MHSDTRNRPAWVPGPALSYYKRSCFYLCEHAEYFNKILVCSFKLCFSLCSFSSVNWSLNYGNNLPYRSRVILLHVSSHIHRCILISLSVFSRAYGDGALRGGLLKVENWHCVDEDFLVTSILESLSLLNLGLLFGCIHLFGLTYSHVGINAYILY